MAEIVLTKENFDEEVLNSDKPVLVDFWAAWCGPCRMIAPILSEIEKELDGKIKVGKVNVDEQPELTYQYFVNNIPALMVFKDGEIAESTIGYHSKEEILALL